MCGIVGYIGDKQATPILIQGLKRLEYRGYDSAGVAIYNGDKIEVKKCKGRLETLENKLKNNTLTGVLGIGHTRWATHGEPSDVNSHPHTDMKGEFAVVHNGIIENYVQLKEILTEKGYKFVSDTDTEVIAHLLDYCSDGDILSTVRKTITKLEGSYALGIISKKQPNKMIAVRKDSPLIIGLGKGENFVASDIPAVLKYTRDIYILEDKEIAEISTDEIVITDMEGRKIDKEVFKVTWDIEAAEKGGYEHFMIKEIHEEPKAIKDTLLSRLDFNDFSINLDEIKITAQAIKDITKIYIVACGTAYHAGLIGKHIFEKYTGIPVEVDVASEFRYRNPIINKNMLVILVSQSGETADTLAALRLAKNEGAKTLAITNVVGSTISREADYVFYTWAGLEIAVASTKAYTTQLIALYIIMLDFAVKKDNITKEQVKAFMEELQMLPEKAAKVIENKEIIQKLAENNYTCHDMFYLGRGLDYSVALEGALKLKEISYIHAEAYAAGELKHGPIALIEDGTPVITLATQDNLYEKMLSNIKEVKARGAKVIAISKEGNKEVEKSADYVVYIPRCMEELVPVLMVIPLQLFAYYTAVARGCDVDKPRNLAKSVTVE